MAGPEGYIRRFVNEGPTMITLLSRLREQRQRYEPTPYLDNLLAACSQKSREIAKTPETQPRPQHGLLDPLSERELGVLREIARGSSNQEIADLLVISVETVKRHVSNILSKLAAANRTQAVALARRLDLLSDEAQYQQA